LEATYDAAMVAANSAANEIDPFMPWQLNSFASSIDLCQSAAQTFGLL
jgi:hypothetical protein